MFTIPQISLMLVALDVAGKTLACEGDKHRRTADNATPLLDPTKPLYERIATLCDEHVIAFKDLECNLRQYLLNEKNKQNLEEKL
jgi:hypothetical protein